MFKFFGITVSPSTKAQIRSQIGRIFRLALLAGAGVAYPIISGWHSFPSGAALEAAAVVVGEAMFRAIWPTVKQDVEADIPLVEEGAPAPVAQVSPPVVQAPVPSPETPPAVF